MPRIYTNRHIKGAYIYSSLLVYPIIYVGFNPYHAKFLKWNNPSSIFGSIIIILGILRWKHEVGQPTVYNLYTIFSYTPWYWNDNGQFKNGNGVKWLTHQTSNLKIANPSQGQAVVSLSKKLYSKCSVLVGSRNEIRECFYTR